MDHTNDIQNIIRPLCFNWKSCPTDESEQQLQTTGLDLKIIEANPQYV